MSSLAGYLLKTNAQHTEYHRRWIVYYGSRMLYYYKSEKDAAKGEPKGHINLDEAVLRIGNVQVHRAQTRRTFSWKKEADAPTSYLFSIETDGRMYKFACETEREMLQWGKALSQGMQPTLSAGIDSKTDKNDSQQLSPTRVGGDWVHPKFTAPSSADVKKRVDESKTTGNTTHESGWDATAIQYDKNLSTQASSHKSECNTQEPPSRLIVQLHGITNACALLLGKTRVDQLMGSSETNTAEVLDSLEISPDSVFSVRLTLSESAQALRDSIPLPSKLYSSLVSSLQPDPASEDTLHADDNPLIHGDIHSAPSPLASPEEAPPEESVREHVLDPGDVTTDAAGVNLHDHSRRSIGNASDNAATTNDHSDGSAFHLRPVPTRISQASDGLSKSEKLVQALSSGCHSQSLFGFTVVPDPNKSPSHKYTAPGRVLRLTVGLRNSFKHRQLGKISIPLNDLQSVCKAILPEAFNDVKTLEGNENMLNGAEVKSLVAEPPILLDLPLWELKNCQDKNQERIASMVPTLRLTLRWTADSSFERGKAAVSEPSLHNPAVSPIRTLSTQKAASLKMLNEASIGAKYEFGQEETAAGIISSSAIPVEHDLPVMTPHQRLEQFLKGDRKFDFRFLAEAFNVNVVDDLYPPAFKQALQTSQSINALHGEIVEQHAPVGLTRLSSRSEFEAFNKAIACLTSSKDDDQRMASNVFDQVSDEVDEDNDDASTVSSISYVPSDDDNDDAESVCATEKLMHKATLHKRRFASLSPEARRSTFKRTQGQLAGLDDKKLENRHSAKLLDPDSVGVCPISCMPISVDNISWSRLTDKMLEAASSDEIDEAPQRVMSPTWSREVLSSAASRYRFRSGSHRITLQLFCARDLMLPIKWDGIGDQTSATLLQSNLMGVPIHIPNLLVHAEIVGLGISTPPQKVFSKLQPHSIAMPWYAAMKRKRERATAHEHNTHLTAIPENASSEQSVKVASKAMLKRFQWTFDDFIAFDLPALSETQLKSAVLRIQLRSPAHQRLHDATGGEVEVTSECVLGEFVAPLAIIYHQMVHQEGPNPQWRRWIAFGAPPRQSDVMNHIFDRANSPMLCGSESVRFARGFAWVSVGFDSGRKSGEALCNIPTAVNEQAEQRLALGPYLSRTDAEDICDAITETSDYNERVFKLPLANVPRFLPIRTQHEGFAGAQVVFPPHLQPKLYCLSVTIHKCVDLPAMDEGLFGTVGRGIDAYVKADVGGAAAFTPVVSVRGNELLSVDFDTRLRIPVWLPLPSTSDRASFCTAEERHAAAQYAIAMDESYRSQVGAVPGLNMGNDVSKETNLILKPFKSVFTSVSKAVKMSATSVSKCVNAAIGIPGLKIDSDEDGDTKTPLAHLLATVEAGEKAVAELSKKNNRTGLLGKSKSKMQDGTQEMLEHAQSALPSATQRDKMRIREIDWWPEGLKDENVSHPTMGIHTKRLQDAYIRAGDGSSTDRPCFPDRLVLSVWDQDKLQPHERVGSVHLSLNDIAAAQMQRRLSKVEKFKESSNTTQEEIHANIEAANKIGVGPIWLPIYGSGLTPEGGIGILNKNGEAATRVQNVDPRLSTAYRGAMLVSLRLEPWSNVCGCSLAADVDADEYVDARYDQMDSDKNERKFFNVDEHHRHSLFADAAFLRPPRLQLQTRQNSTENQGMNHSDATKDIPGMGMTVLQYFSVLGALLEPSAPTPFRARISVGRVSPLGSKHLEGKFSLYSMAAIIVSATEMPWLASRTNWGQSSKMKVSVAVGPNRKHSSRESQEQGRSYFQQLLGLEDMVFPLGSHQLSDMFIYITDRDGRNVCYARIPATKVIAHTRRWSWRGPPLWVNMIPDPSCHIVDADGVGNAGSICLWLGMDRSSVMRKTIRRRTRHFQETYAMFEPIAEKLRLMNISIPASSLLSRDAFEKFLATHAHSLELGTHRHRSSVDSMSSLATKCLTADDGTRQKKPSLRRLLLWENKLAGAVNRDEMTGSMRPFQLRVHVFQARHLLSMGSVRSLSPYFTIRLGEALCRTKTLSGNQHLSWAETAELNSLLAWQPKAPTKKLLDLMLQRSRTRKQTRYNYELIVGGDASTVKLGAPASDEAFDNSPEAVERRIQNALEVYGAANIETELAPELILELWDKRTLGADKRIASTRLNLDDASIVDSDTLFQEEYFRQANSPERKMLEKLFGKIPLTINVSEQLPLPHWIGLNPEFGGLWRAGDNAAASLQRIVDIRSSFAVNVPDSNVLQRLYRHIALSTGNLARAAHGLEYDVPLLLPFAHGAAAPCKPEVLLSMQLIPRVTMTANDAGQSFGTNLVEDRVPVPLSPAPALLPATRRVRIHVVIPWAYGMSTALGNVSAAEQPVIDIGLSGGFSQTDTADDSKINGLGKATKPGDKSLSSTGWNLSKAKHHIARPSDTITLQECDSGFLATGKTGLAALAAEFSVILGGASKRVFGSGSKHGVPGPVLPTQLVMRATARERLQVKSQSVMLSGTVAHESAEQLPTAQEVPGYVQELATAAADRGIWEYMTRRYFGWRVSIDTELPDSSRVAWQMVEQLLSKEDTDATMSDEASDSSEDEGSDPTAAGVDNNHSKNIDDDTLPMLGQQLSTQQRRTLRRWAKTISPRLHFRLREASVIMGIQTPKSMQPKTSNLAPLPPSKTYSNYHVQGFIGESSIGLPLDSLWWALAGSHLDDTTTTTITHLTLYRKAFAVRLAVLNLQRRWRTILLQRQTQGTDITPNTNSWWTPSHLKQIGIKSVQHAFKTVSSLTHNGIKVAGAVQSGLTSGAMRVSSGVGRFLPKSGGRSRRQGVSFSIETRIQAPKGTTTNTRYAKDYYDPTIAQTHLPKFMRYRISLPVPLENILEEDKPLFKDYPVYAPMRMNVSSDINNKSRALSQSVNDFHVTGTVKAAIVIEDLSEDEVASRWRYAYYNKRRKGAAATTTKALISSQMQSRNMIPRVISLASQPRRVVVRCYLVSAAVSTGVLNGVVDTDLGLRQMLSRQQGSHEQMRGLTDEHTRLLTEAQHPLSLFRVHLCGTSKSTTPIPWVSSKVMSYQRVYGSRPACLTDFGVDRISLPDASMSFDRVSDVLQCVELETTLPGIPLLTVEMWHAPNEEQHDGASPGAASPGILQESPSYKHSIQRRQLKFVGGTIVDLERRWLTPSWHSLGVQRQFVMKRGKKAESRLRPIPIETRSLLAPAPINLNNGTSSRHPDALNVGAVRMWVDILTQDEAKVFSPYVIRPPPRQRMIFRVVVWRVRRLQSRHGSVFNSAQNTINDVNHTEGDPASGITDDAHVSNSDQEEQDPTRTDQNVSPAYSDIPLPPYGIPLLRDKVAAEKITRLTRQRRISAVLHVPGMVSKRSKHTGLYQTTDTQTTMETCSNEGVNNDQSANQSGNTSMDGTLHQPSTNDQTSKKDTVRRAYRYDQSTATSNPLSTTANRNHVTPKVGQQKRVTIRSPTEEEYEPSTIEKSLQYYPGYVETMSASNNSLPLPTNVLSARLPSKLRKAKSPTKYSLKTLLKKYTNDEGITPWVMRACVLDPVSSFASTTHTKSKQHKDSSPFIAPPTSKRKCVSPPQFTYRPAVMVPQLDFPNKEAEALATLHASDNGADANDNKKLQSRKQVRRSIRAYGKPRVIGEHAVFNWRLLLPIHHTRFGRRPPPAALRLEFCRAVNPNRSKLNNKTTTQDASTETKPPVKGPILDCIGSAELDIAELVEQVAAQQHPHEATLMLHGKFERAYLDQFGRLVSTHTADRVQGVTQEAFWIPLKTKCVPGTGWKADKVAEVTASEQIQALVSVQAIPESMADELPAGEGRAKPNMNPLLVNPSRLRELAIEQLRVAAGGNCCPFM